MLNNPNCNRVLTINRTFKLASELRGIASGFHPLAMTVKFVILCFSAAIPVYHQSGNGMKK